jgi:Diaminopimelate decarboxylase
MEKFKSVDELVNQLKPSNPVYCIRKHTLKKASKFFQKNFKGKILYAVKANPSEFVLKTLFDSGINNFDIASIKEIEKIKKISPKGICHYMNAVKSRENISEAYFKYGVKSFSLDTKDELIKIINATKNAKDLKLFVRIAVSNEHAEIDLSKKFGAQPNEAVGLQRVTKQYAKKID